MTSGQKRGQESAARSQPDVPENPGDSVADSPALFLVKGDATPEEVAALAVVLQGIVAASAPAPEPKVVSEWSANHRRLRPSYPAGPGGWRSSGLPR
jgi:hypothetical protein